MSDPNPSILKGNSEPVPFESLLRLLDPDRNRAGEKYEYLRRKLIKFFEWNSCFPAEDLADETFQRLEQKVGKAEIRDVAGFAWGIAKKIRQESKKEDSRLVHIADISLSEAPWDAQNSEKALTEKMQQERRFKCLQLCLQRMPEGERDLFLAYHNNNKEAEDPLYRQELAKRMGLTIGTLRVRMNRLRTGLEKCARQCFDSWKINSRKSL